MISVGVVVPNFNGGRFLQECLDSILEQDYAPLTCLVRDGASSDESVSVLKTYGTRVAWISERDAGQADAIGRGFAALETDMVGWLNSDDVLEPGAIRRVSEAALNHPSAVLFHGDVKRIDVDGKLIDVLRSRDITREQLRRGRGSVVQPGSFYRRHAVEACGGVDPSFHLLMDVDLWARLLLVGPSVRISSPPLARFRVHADAKSSQAPYRYYAESIKLGLRHERDQILRAMLRRSGRIAVDYARHLGRRITQRSRK